MDGGVRHVIHIVNAYFDLDHIVGVAGVARAVLFANAWKLPCPTSLKTNRKSTIMFKQF